MTKQRPSSANAKIRWPGEDICPKSTVQRFMLLAVSIAVFTAFSACVPTSSGEFDTGASPTKTGGERLDLVTGVADGSIASISYNAGPQKYLISYQSEQISEKALTEAQGRMCRFRRLTFDKIEWDRPVKFTANGAPDEVVEYYRTLRNRVFSCK